MSISLHGDAYVDYLVDSGQAFNPTAGWTELLRRFAL